MKKLSILLIFFSMWSSGFAQEKAFVIKGKVVDPKGNPIAEARIYQAKDTSDNVTSDKHGLFALFSSTAIEALTVKKAGYEPQTVAASGSSFLEVILHPGVYEQKAVPLKEEEADYTVQAEHVQPIHHKQLTGKVAMGMHSSGHVQYDRQAPQWNTESYTAIEENGFRSVVDEPLSTFSADVDRASYSNVRRFLNLGQLPPVDAVRVEEMINYFEYDYASPEGDDPVKIYTEVAKAPWNEEHYVMHIGIKAREMDKSQLPPSNLVFLIDVSGSMGASNKLPLLKSSMKMLVDELRPEDRVAIVVYAGAAGLVLPSTSGAEKEKIKQAIDRLHSGGSTAGGAGIKLAYKTAVDHFVEQGNNRVILATDGDFNIGASSNAAMQRLIEEEREKGVFLTTLGFGMGNYKDSKMETLADQGNGNYAYIDNLTEAKKTLVEEFGGTLFTIAKDVKLQVEFNPATVDEYRLIGYENRLLNNEDFNDDTKDAGEMGVGHVVTAMYEVIPKGKGGGSKVDPLKYSPEVDSPPFKDRFVDELATVKVRYKAPEGGASKLISQGIENDLHSLDMASENLRWSSSVAAFGMHLRGSEYVKGMKWKDLQAQAKSALGKDPQGYRRECLQLMHSAESLLKHTAER